MSTLRHRTGGTDAGWHLKLPVGADREELRSAGPAGQVPDGLAALVRAWTRGRNLEPVAVLTTHRTVRHLLNDEHQALAELADDRVRGRALPAGEELLWREWELELLTGDRDLLEQVQQRLATVGAAPSGTGSKLARLLPRPAADPAPRPWWSGRPGGKGRLSAGTVVQSHLAEQVSELVNRDPQVRRDLPDSVHKMRVATRRLRRSWENCSTALRNTSSPLIGTTNWYCTKPRRPYTRFHPPTPSNGWKNSVRDCRPCCARGAFRYQISLKARTVLVFSSPPGTHGGADSREDGA